MSVGMAGGEPAVLRGAVLRAWRENEGVGVRELARRLGVQPGAVTMRENGTRAVKSAASVSTVMEIAAKLGLAPDHAQAMKDMWLAAASITAVEPRADWAHNYQWPSEPGWVWLRCPEPPAALTVKGWWSDPLQGELQMEVGAGGVFVQFFKTIANPPLEVVFAEPVGWADFGKGTVPQTVAEALGASVIDARTLAKPVAQFEPPLRDHVFAGLLRYIRVFKNIADKAGIAWVLLRPHFGIAAFDRPPHPAVDVEVSRTPEACGIKLDDVGWIISQPLVEPAQFQKLRRARGLSREAAASQATEMDQRCPLTASALRGYEEAGSVPATELFFSRLDAVYDAAGRFGIDVVHRKYALEDIVFPGYWQGPVWLQVRGPEHGTIGVIELVWGPWSRKQYVHSGTVLTTRKATSDMPALICKIPPGWQVRAGTGLISAAVDINHGWHPKSMGAAVGLIVTHIPKVTPI
jgi:transcriptional regulator with XRE-family HTH domain